MYVQIVNLTIGFSFLVMVRLTFIEQRKNIYVFKELSM